MKKQILDEKAVLEGRSYEADKPWSCKYCYFWEGKKKGCGLDECYYLLPEDVAGADARKPPKLGNCSRCPYGKYSPCIGYCIARIYYEVVQEKREKKGEADGRGEETGISLSLRE